MAATRSNGTVNVTKLAGLVETAVKDAKRDGRLDAALAAWRANHLSLD